MRFGEAPNDATVKSLVEDCDTRIFVNLRKETDYTCEPRNHQKGYFKEKGIDVKPSVNGKDRYFYQLLMFQPESDYTFISETMDNIEDVNEKSVMALAKRIHKEWSADKTRSIYIHNRDGLGTEAIVAFTVFGLMMENKDFKPLEWLQQEGHYEVCLKRMEKEMLKSLWKHAQKRFFLLKQFQPEKKKRKQ